MTKIYFLKCKIIFFSSGGTIYGKQSGAITEEAELEPINYYGFSSDIIMHVAIASSLGVIFLTSISSIYRK